MKGVLIAVIVLVLAIGGYLIFAPGKINVSESEPWDLYDHSLVHEEVKAILGNQVVDNYDVSPSQSLSQETYDKINSLKPTCLNELDLGEGVRIVTYHTAGDSLDIVYSTESNNVECVFEFSPEN